MGVVITECVIEHKKYLVSDKVNELLDKCYRVQNMIQGAKKSCLTIIIETVITTTATRALYQ